MGGMEDMEMNQTGEAAMESPVTMITGDGKIDVNLSWNPEMINIDDQPTTFTLEFLDAGTGQRLSNVTYAVHMMFNGKDFGHGHNETAVDGIGTMEQEFTSVGTLAMVVEIQKVGNADVNQFAQFSIAVTPEFPAAAVAFAAGVGATAGLSIVGAKRRL